MEDKYNNLIKNSIDDLTNNITKLMNNNYENIYNKLESEIKDDLMKKIHGYELYNYDGLEVNEFVYNDCGNLIKHNNIKDFLNKLDYDLNGQNINNKNIFLNSFIENEKVVLYRCILVSDKIDGIEYIILITNYSRLLFINKNYGSYIWKFAVKFINYNFWIPLDYIKLLNNTFVKYNIHSNANYYKKSEFKIEDIQKIFEDMKQTLYNRKIMPLYVLDIIKENEKLKSMHNEYEKILYILEKPENKAIISIDEEKNKIEEAKKRLKMIAKKLELDKIAFEKEKQEFNDININDI